jgi:hypothetical protein
LKELWTLREPTPEEIQWLRNIVGDSELANFIAESKRSKRKIPYYKRQKLITNLINRIYKERGSIIKESIEKDYEKILSNQKYQNIIREIEKYAFPNWFQRIKIRPD